MDAETGEVLFEKAADKRRPVASTTKILTALVVLDRTQLSAALTVPAAAAAIGESSAQLVKGERRTVRELLYALLLRSANDAAGALAIHVGKSIPGFARMMNEKAVHIGATRTHFSNPHGLTAPRHYSTARDLALITAYGLRNPTFAEIVRTKEKKIPWPRHRYPRVFTNHNKLLWRMPEAIGVKTGYTIPAGNCLVGAAQRGETKLIAVVLGCGSASDAYLSASFLLNYGLSGYKAASSIMKGKTYATLPVRQLPGMSAELIAADTAVPNAFADGRETTLTCLVPLEARPPVSRGECLGEARIVRDGKVLASVPLVAKTDIDAPTLWDRLAAVCLNSARSSGNLSSQETSTRLTR